MELYYFSATGNTLSTARMLAGCLGGECRLVPMASLADEDVIEADHDAVGFLYPVYNGDMPYIVRDTISRIKFTGNPYIFSVCTYRGNYGSVAVRLNDVLERKGQKLSMHTGVKMPGNSRLSEPGDIEAALESQPENVRAAAKRVTGRETDDFSGAEFPGPSPFTDGAKNVRGMKADDTCVGCGLCVKVCPMNNISLEDGHAVMGDRCLTCLACFHWCPNESIYMSALDGDMARRVKYRHPDVTVDDIIAQKGE